MKRVKKIILCLWAVTIAFTAFFPRDTVSAAVKVGKTNKIVCQTRDKNGTEPYYKYTKGDGSVLGDICSAEIKWSTVPKADGYRVRMYFVDDQGEKTKDTVYVKKSKGKYVMTKKGGWHGISCVGKKVKVHTEWGDYTTQLHNKIKGDVMTCQSKNLHFVSTFGTSEYLEKISIQAYRNVGGKKVYGKSMSKKYKITW